MVTARATFSDTSSGLIWSRNQSRSCAGERNGAAPVVPPAVPGLLLFLVATILLIRLSSKLRQNRIQVFLRQLGFREVRWRVNRVGCFAFAKQGTQFCERSFSQPFNRLARMNVFAV